MVPDSLLGSLSSCVFLPVGRDGEEGEGPYVPLKTPKMQVSGPEVKWKIIPLSLSLECEGSLGKAGIFLSVFLALYPRHLGPGQAHSWGFNQYLLNQEISKL